MLKLFVNRCGEMVTMVGWLEERSNGGMGVDIGFEFSLEHVNKCRIMGSR